MSQISIPDSVETIGGLVFCGCASLEKLEIPQSVKQIGNAAFKKCSSLSHLAIPAAATQQSNSNLGIGPDVEVIRY